MLSAFPPLRTKRVQKLVIGYQRDHGKPFDSFLVVETLNFACFRSFGGHRFLTITDVGGGATDAARILELRLGYDHLPLMAALAIGFATLVGVFFGFYPAWRASQLSLIDALRYE